MAKQNARTKFVALGSTSVALALALAVLSLQPAQAGGFKLFRLSKSQEGKIAGEMHTEFEKDPGLITEGKQYKLVQQIGKKLVEENELDQYDYQFFLVKQDEVNAFATPGGYIYVTKGLMDLMGYDPGMVAGVMAHELGHAKDRHVAKGYEKAMTGVAGLAILSLLAGNNNGDLINVMGGAGAVMYLKYNRDQEEWADRYGVDMAFAAGYDAYGLMRSLQCLEVLYGSTDDAGTWLANHPATSDRIIRTRRIARETSGKPLGYMAIPKPPKKDHPLWELYGSGKGEGGVGTAESYSRSEGGKQTQEK